MTFSPSDYIIDNSLKIYHYEGILYVLVNEKLGLTNVNFIWKELYNKNLFTFLGGRLKEVVTNPLFNVYSHSAFLKCVKNMSSSFYLIVILFSTVFTNISY